MMPGRSYSAPNNSYRYGFNGKENDNEVKGEGNEQDYGMRIYDTRLGRFLSVDPLTRSYPWYTPYQFAGNKPITSVDLDGLEEANKANSGVFSDAPVLKYNTGAITRPPNSGNDPLTRFAIGVIKVAVGTFGAGTELAYSAHHGERVKDKEETFPLTHGNLFYTIKQALISPVVLANRLKNHPDDAEAWGEAATFLSMFKINLAVKGSAPDIALGLNEPSLLGPPRTLVRFADYTNSYMHYDWGTTFGSLGSAKSTDISFGDIFTRVVDHVASNKGTIKFDLTNFSMGQAVTDLGKTAADASSLTNYEFNTIMGSEKYLKATEFYRDGKKVNSSDVVKEYNTLKAKKQ